jgi:hypothetical protein
MYSKYILPSNWIALSGNYSFDQSVSFNNLLLPTAGNLSVNYSSLVDNVADYSNNNYSNFILTKGLPLSGLISKKVEIMNLNKSTCVIAKDLNNGIVSDVTRFLKFNTNLSPSSNTVLTLNSDNYFEILFISGNELIVKKDMGEYNVYMAADDNSNLVTYLTSVEKFENSRYDTDKIKFNYYLKDDNILLYKIIQKQLFFVSIVNAGVNFINGSLEDIPKDSRLNYVKIGDLSVDNYSLDFLSYKRDINKNNLFVSREKSSYGLHSNFLNHCEYNNISDNKADINFLTLKNHFNVTDEAASVNGLTGYRKYTSIFTGGNAEGGADKISLNYKSNFFTLLLEPDKTTWFHLPYDFSQKPIKLSETNFIESGAVGSSSPIFSDKIWKRLAGYTYTSNQAAVSGDEQSGRWLCSWLSGGFNDQYVWMDRFYNPDIFTAINALKFKNNVDYTPQYKNKRALGITDVPSQLTLEPGVWYAYSRIGKKTAQQILSGSPFLIKSSLDSFTNQNNSAITVTNDTDGAPVYEFSGNQIGKFNAPQDLSFNNFSISFFATRKNWNKSNFYSLMGNYVDKGFSIINNNKFNPCIYHVNDKIVYLLNANYDVILKIDASAYVSGDFTISAVFRRDVNENFHLITSNLFLLEFNSTGTLVDLTNLSSLMGANSSIVSYTNNNRFGIVKTSNNNFYKVNLLTNETVLDNTVSIVGNETSVRRDGIVIDAFDKVYTVNGYDPIIKGTLLYYKSIDGNQIRVFNISDNTLKTYITSLSGIIISYNFNELDETILLYKDFVAVYNELGELKTTFNIETDFSSITSCNLLLQDLCNDNYKPSIHFINHKNENCLYSINDKKYKIISKTNSFYNTLCSSIFFAKNFDMTNYNYIQSVVNSNFPLPSYNFKLKLYNQLNSEDIKNLNITVLGETFDVGTHHICAVLDTLEGYFSVFVNGRVYSTISFPAKKYSLLNIFSNGFTIGSVPFYNNINYSDFYGRDILKNADDLKIEKFKLFSNTLNKEEVRLLYYEKFPPTEINVNLKTGERNYLETITRTFRHKLQGSKSNLINLTINNSLMIDVDVRKLYESIILRELNPYLPANVRINKIEWIDTVNSIDKMIVGNYSIKNTLTDTGDLPQL